MDSQAVTKRDALLASRQVFPPHFLQSLARVKSVRGDESARYSPSDVPARSVSISFCIIGLIAVPLSHGSDKEEEEKHGWKESIPGRRATYVH